MPEICRFYGIVIKMYIDDHNPPHFHAEYSDNEALINLKTLDVFSGQLPIRAQALVSEWATLKGASSRLGKGQKLRTFGKDRASSLNSSRGIFEKSRITD